MEISQIINILKTCDDVLFAYLFGSYAKATQHAYSDIDIAVYFKKESDTFDTRLKIHHLLEINLHKEIDLVVLNRAKNFDLLNDIFRDGVILKDSLDDKRVMYELHKEHEIKDYKVFKRMLNVA